MEDYLPLHSSQKELFATEVKNLSLYGYGIKGYMLSMIETALEVTKGTLDVSAISIIIQYGHELLQRPIELLDNMEEVLSQLKPHYRLVVATKGDLLDQERKLKKSGLEHYFHHIEIMSDKQETDYLKLIRHLDISPDSFLMVGNSLKSDVIPVLNAGGHAIHIPFHTTWEHEQVAHHVEHNNFREIKKVLDLLPILLPKV
jgi:putative hydrolase of the HAD superfamily